MSDPRNYEPAMYQVVKSAKDLKDNESLVDIQKGFVRRTEKLLKEHKERATISDGLKGLSDKEVIQKMREVPTKLKRDTKSLLKKLEKYNVTLNEYGHVDYSGVPFPHIRKQLVAMDTLVKIALMQKDLDFEYPQHLEKKKIKGDILNLANAEESKLQKMEQERVLREQQAVELNYEQYFGTFVSNEVKDISEFTKETKVSTKRGSYEDFVKERASRYIYDNDLLEKSYKFWEEPHEREKRLKEIWIDLKRKNALEGPDARTTMEQLELQEHIVDKIRDLRWKIDQEMVKNNLEPLFKKAYHKYTKDEFLFDADIQFSKLKDFLKKNPRVLKEDPIIGQEYMGIINLIRRKKLLEYTTPAYRREHEESLDDQKAKIQRRRREKLKQEFEIATEMDRLAIDDDPADAGSTPTGGPPEPKGKVGKTDSDSLLKQFQSIAKK